MSPVRFRQTLLVLWALSSGAVASTIFAPDAQNDIQQVLQPDSSQPSRSLQGRFLHITDFHPDDFYKIHSSTEEGIACHRSKGLAGAYGAERTDCDSPFSLVNATFDWLEQYVKDKVDFVVWTGDTARHDSDEKHPRNTPEVLDTNRVVANKFVDTFNSKDGKLAIPVIPTFGNNDFLPHNIFYPGPNKWLRAYSDIWKRFIPEEQYHSFQFGGWFYVDVIPNKLAVFSLNTMYFFDRNAGVDGCAKPSEPGFKHMEWLRVQLQRMRDSGMKAILIGHVPPARTSNKRNWDETCWQRYTLWLKQYRDVVVGALYGHMNIDHFLLQDSWDIDLGLDAEELQSRDSLEDEVSVESKQDYLQELRSSWSDLPGSVVQGLDQDEDDGAVDISKKHRKKKYKKIGGKHAERYQVTLVSPSIVPNYFPTIRIIEYNITGLEQTALWTDSFDLSNPVESGKWEEEEIHEELKREVMDASKKKKKKKGKKGKNPKDPNLVVPDDPPKRSLPGPAYMAQPFTFTGYTQYFANLTHINNDIADADVDGSKWRNGDHAEDQPKHSKPQPRDFNFEVEYSTFDDNLYKLSDLTVKSYVKLAYRIAKEEKKKKKGKGKSNEIEETEMGEEDGLMEQEDLDDFDEYEPEEEDIDGAYPSDEDVVDGAGKKHKKHRKGKKNKVWMHFLRHAFVNTATEAELDKLS